MTIARYSFLPWLRRGIATQIKAAAGASSRATVPVTVTIANDAGEDALPPRDLQLIGPGDVLGFHADQVVRTEPRDGVTDFEPNYLACVELYDEDFAWRYTPAPADGTHRLAPWLTLLVLKRSEFTRDRSGGRTLQSITLAGGIDPKNVFPPDGQHWAWAHVHLNDDLGADSHTPNLDVLDGMLRRNPDIGYSRLMCPRRLEPNTPYHAFVVPTFNVGRKIALAEPVADSESGIEVSWKSANRFPVYYEWSFATGPAGDFEDLVTLLVPRRIPKEVGIRDLDIHDPNFHLPPIVSAPDNAVGLEGALLSPFTEPKPLAPDSNFPPEIEKQVNLGTDAVEAGIAADGDDPIITAPLYGRWHALVDRISSRPENRNWVNELNSDPRFRAVAGMGTRVIQKNQEEYMKLAWQQIGDVLALNRKVSFLQMALQASHASYTKHLTPLADARAMAVMSPVFSKVMGSPVTVHYLVKESRLTRATLSGAMRKQLRPRGLIARRAFPANQRYTAFADTIRQVNDGLICAAPPRAAPPGPTLERALEATSPKISDALRWLLDHAAWLAVLILIACFVLAFVLPFGVTFLLVAAVVTAFAYPRLPRLRRSVRAADALAPENLTPDAVAAIPPNDNFSRVSGASAPQPATPTGGPDSVDARDFRKALQDFHALLSARAPIVPPRPALELASVHAKVMQAIAPTQAFPLRAARHLRVGGRSFVEHAKSYHDAVAPLVPERIVPVMAYPDIKAPMYAPLRDISTDLFVPNLDLIPRNTISLMVQNEPFIEAYMVGLNHEFGRELLWREYPTDQRPSTFRQFWDVSNYVDQDDLDPKALAEKLRDITRVHEWGLHTQLGDHNNRDPEGRFRNPSDPLDRMVVLVIRGDLLKRYPNTIIYAQHATWGTRPDNQNQLVLWDETGEKSEGTTKDPNLRFPLYKASVPPDIHFIGFDLTVRQVRGNPQLEETAEAKARIPFDELGWFFVLKEVVGEPRFGLDEHPAASPSTESVWDNLSWAHLAGMSVIDLAAPFALPLPAAPNPGNVNWGANAADTAYILYQKPVLVGVHGKDMLKAKDLI